MGFQVSPGVTTREIDLTTIIPAVSSTEGAIAGVFRWGPVEERVLVDSEETLAARFGKPTNGNAETFFTAANFLSYGNKLYVSRAADTTDTFAGVAFTGSAPVAGANDVKNTSALIGKTFNSNVYFVARHLGVLGNSLKISVCDTSSAFSSTVNLLKTGLDTTITKTFIAFIPGTKTAIITLEVAANATDLNNAKAAVDAELTVGDLIDVNGQMMKINSLAAFSANQGAGPISATKVITFKQNYNGVANLSLQNFIRKWEYFTSFNKAPGTSNYFSDRGLTAVDEFHAVVVDEDGMFSAAPGTVLEAFENLSRATDAKTETGANNHFRDVINTVSNYIWVASDISPGYSAASGTISSLSTLIPSSYSFTLGADGKDEATVALSAVVAAYNMFKDAADVDISLLLSGKSRGNVIANYLIANIAEVRKDCLVFISPEYSDVVNPLGSALDAVIGFRNSLSQNTSYGVMDSGYVYHYDKYNDVYRYVPLNGDTAGTVVRTDSEKDPWWSPAGFNRGQIKNVVKLAWNPTKAERDQLYQSDINPIVTFPGQGTVLFGDKTLFGKPSAFDRINVRRLFIVLEKAIAIAANSFLFEFNNEFTRTRFVQMVEPFLRDIQGRQGITDFLVVADSSNNTSSVIDRNEFVATIMIAPARSINYITLNFVATRTNVTFSELVGSV